MLKQYTNMDTAYQKPATRLETRGLKRPLYEMKHIGMPNPFVRESEGSPSSADWLNLQPNPQDHPPWPNTLLDPSPPSSTPRPWCSLHPTYRLCLSPPNNQTSSQLGFYAKYRTPPFLKLSSNGTDSHPVNIAIHMIFVPLIYATAVLLVGLIAPIPISSNLPPLNLADLLVSVYAVGYILLEPLAGVLMLPFHLGVAYCAHTLPTMFERGDIAKCAGAANVASWIAQFMGHGLAEGRAPALFDNLFQVHPFCPLPPRSRVLCKTSMGRSRCVWWRETNR